MAMWRDQMACECPERECRCWASAALCGGGLFRRSENVEVLHRTLATIGGAEDIADDSNAVGAGFDDGGGGVQRDAADGHDRFLCERADLADQFGADYRIRIGF